MNMNVNSIEDLIRELWARGITIQEISDTYDKFDKEMEDHYKLEDAREALASAMIDYIRMLVPNSKITKEDAMRDLEDAEPTMKKKTKEEKHAEDNIEKWLKGEDLLF
jgi:hypothetical protein